MTGLSPKVNDDSVDANADVGVTSADAADSTTDDAVDVTVVVDAVDPAESESFSPLALAGRIVNDSGLRGAEVVGAGRAGAPLTRLLAPLVFQ